LKQHKPWKLPSPSSYLLFSQSNSF
jgi:hypothetical protein